VAGDHSVAIYKWRMNRTIRRSYAIQIVACVSGGLIAWCVFECALDRHYSSAAICTSLLLLSIATFYYAARDRAHAEKTLAMLNDTERATDDRDDRLGARAA
jgi:hypothetical protein